MFKDETVQEIQGTISQERVQTYQDPLNGNLQQENLPSVPSYDHYDALQIPRENPNYKPENIPPTVYLPMSTTIVQPVVYQNFPVATVVQPVTIEISNSRRATQGISTFLMLIGSFCFIGFGIFFIVMISMGYTNSLVLIGFNNQRNSNSTVSVGVDLGNNTMYFDALNIVTFSLLIVLGFLGLIL